MVTFGFFTTVWKVHAVPNKKGPRGGVMTMMVCCEDSADPKEMFQSLWNGNFFLVLEADIRS